MSNCLANSGCNGCVAYITDKTIIMQYTTIKRLILKVQGVFSGKQAADYRTAAMTAPCRCFTCCCAAAGLRAAPAGRPRRLPWPVGRAAGTRCVGGNHGNALHALRAGAQAAQQVAAAEHRARHTATPAPAPRPGTRRTTYRPGRRARR